MIRQFFEKLFGPEPTVLVKVMTLSYKNRPGAAKILVQSDDPELLDYLTQRIGKIFPADGQPETQTYEPTYDPFDHGRTIYGAIMGRHKEDL